MQKKLTLKYLLFAAAMFIVAFSSGFIIVERTAFASFIINAWQGYKLTEGLVGYWSFDGRDMRIDLTTAEVRDASGSGKHGDWVNHATTTTIGKIGQGIAFDGVNDYVTASVAPTGPNTISLWIYPKSNVAAGLFGRLSSGYTDYGWGLKRDSSGNVRAISAQNNAEWYSNLFANTPLNEWSHVVVTFSGTSGSGTGNLYVNGILAATHTGTLSTYGYDFGIGAKLGNTTGHYFYGSIDEARLYNRALSADEIKRLYLMGASLKTNVSHRDELTGGLVGYWTFDGKDMTPNVRDVSGSGNHGGLQNQNPTTTTIGKIGQGLSFDGVDDSLNLGDVAVIDTATTLSSCAWVKHNVLTSDDGIISKRPSGPGDSFVFFRDDVGYASGRTDTYTILIADSADTSEARIEGVRGASKADTWTHVCFTFEISATGLRLYINGVEDVNSPVSTESIAAIDGGARALEIGNNSLGALFDGAIDETRIYTRVLSADEIKRLYLMGASLKINVSHRDELTEGLVGNWTFDGKDIDLSQVTAEVRDTSGQGNNGDWKNHATTTAIGKIGQAINFDGVDDVIDAGSGASLDNLTAVTISAWINRQNSSGVITNKTTGGTKGFGMLFFNSNLRFEYGFDGASDGRWTVDNPPIPANQWVHVVVTYDKSSAVNNPVMYIDGVSQVVTVNDTPIGNARNDSASSVRINSLSNPFAGTIDDVRVYNRALSAAEVQRLYLMGK